MHKNLQITSFPVMPVTYLFKKFSFLYSADRFHGIAHLQVRRTVKFLCGVGRGIPIVGPEWLVSCREANKFSGMNDAVQ